MLANTADASKERPRSRLVGSGAPLCRINNEFRLYRTGCNAPNPPGIENSLASGTSYLCAALQLDAPERAKSMYAWSLFR